MSSFHQSSIFSVALGRALRRHPASRPLLHRFSHVTGYHPPDSSARHDKNTQQPSDDGLTSDELHRPLRPYETQEHDTLDEVLSRMPASYAPRAEVRAQQDKPANTEESTGTQSDVPEHPRQGETTTYIHRPGMPRFYRYISRDYVPPEPAPDPPPAPAPPPKPASTATTKPRSNDPLPADVAPSATTSPAVPKAPSRPKIHKYITKQGLGLSTPPLQEDNAASTSAAPGSQPQYDTGDKIESVVMGIPTIPKIRRYAAREVPPPRISARLTAQDIEEMKILKEMEAEQKRLRGEEPERPAIVRHTGRMPSMKLKITAEDIEVRNRIRELQEEEMRQLGIEPPPSNINRPEGPAAREAPVAIGSRLEPVENLEEKHYSVDIPAQFTILTRAELEARTPAEIEEARLRKKQMEDREQVLLNARRDELKGILKRLGRKKQELKAMQDSEGLAKTVEKELSIHALLEEIEQKLRQRKSEPNDPPMPAAVDEPKPDLAFGELTREEFERVKRARDSEDGKRNKDERPNVVVKDATLGDLARLKGETVQTATFRPVGKVASPGEYSSDFPSDWLSRPAADYFLGRLTREEYEQRKGIPTGKTNPSTGTQARLTREQIEKLPSFSPDLITKVDPRTRRDIRDELRGTSRNRFRVASGLTGASSSNQDPQVHTQYSHQPSRQLAKPFGVGLGTVTSQTAGRGPDGRHYSTDARHANGHSPLIQERVDSSGLPEDGTGGSYDGVVIGDINIQCSLSTSDSVNQPGTSVNTSAEEIIENGGIPFVEEDILEDEQDFLRDLSDIPSSHKRPGHFLTNRPTLVEVLREIGFADDIPKYHNFKTDLSHTPPLQPVSERPSYNVRRDLKRKRMEKRVPKGKRIAKLNVKEITLRFIDDIYLPYLVGRQKKLDWQPKRLGRVFDEKAWSYLETRGYCPEDVVTWSWILMSETGTASAIKLATYYEKTECRFPPFLVMHVLRRPNIRRSTLMRLMPVIDRLFNPIKPEDAMDAKTKIVMIIRLLRRMRETWPMGIQETTKWWRTVYMPKDNFIPAWVTHTYNRFLSLLAMPMTGAPFEFASVIQKCMLEVVQEMTEKGIVLTREGYRAIVSVQLAQKKLEHEKDTVRTMGVQWPPWPVFKDRRHAMQVALHANLEPRPLQALQQMIEAGYAPSSWETRASILGGKDTDQTPTVQTRSVLKVSTMERDDAPNSMHWAARVRATRTLEEAWWNFIEYKSTLQGKAPAQVVYMELLAKVIWRAKFRRAQEAESRSEERLRMYEGVEGEDQSRATLWLKQRAEVRYRNVAGDGKEVQPTPLNPADGAYTITPPPDLAGLLDMLKSDGIKFNTTIASLLLEEARDHSFAVEVIKSWDEQRATELLHPIVKWLNSDSIVRSTYFENNHKGWHIITAFITYLCRLPGQDALDQAFILLHYHRPRYAPAWNVVIDKLLSQIKKSTTPIHDIILANVWQMYKEMHRHVDPDRETVRLLARAVEFHGRLEHQDALWDGKHPADVLLDVCRAQFMHAQQIFPNTSLYHAIVRALGLSQRYEGIEELLRYIAEKDETVVHETNGSMILIAARAFLEGAHKWAKEPNMEVLERCDKLVMDKWGGWGGEDGWVDSKIDEYCFVGFFMRGEGRVKRLDGENWR